MIQNDRLLESFLAYIQIDSETKSEGAVARKLEAEMKALGCETYVDKAGEALGCDTGNLYCTLPGDPSLEPLIFCAHMDTVKPGKGVRPVIQDGVIRSDGTTILGGDDKVGIAAILEVFRVIQEDKLPHPTLTALFTIHEESGVMGSKNLEYDRLKGNKAFVLDSAGAPGLVMVSAPGQNKLYVTIHGKSAHAGICPEEGISAIQVAADAISHMKLLRIDEETTANIGTFTAEYATNVVPDKVEIIGEVRSRNNEKLQAHTKHLMDCIEEACARFGAAYSGGPRPSYVSYNIPADSDFIKLVREACGKTGLEMVLVPGGGGSDANNMNLNGIVAAPVGTGMTRVHTVEESLAIKDLEDLARWVLALAVK